MDDATKEAILSLVKIILTSAGTFATTYLGLNGEMTQAAIALAMTLLTAGWAIWDRLKKSKQQQKNVTAAVNSGIAYSNETPSPTPPVSAREAKAVIEQYAPPTEGTKP